VMLSQLHSVFTTHTLIERELSTLISAGHVRKLLLRGLSPAGKGGQVSGAGGEFGLVLVQTFNDLLRPHATDLPAFSKWTESEAARGVVSISHSALLAQNVPDAEIKKAVEAGFLTLEYSIREPGYTLSLPGTGPFIRNLRGGRKELLRALKRQRYKEMLEKTLREKKLRDSLLAYGFHLHELVGSGRVDLFGTPAGRGIRITSRGLADVG
jgi:Serine-threonine protein kinase 19